MSRALRAFLSGVVDYAGLFPPANLPLEEAFPNYLRYRTEAESWMLGNFIISASRLAELDTFEKEIKPEKTPITLTTLGRGSNDVKSFVDGFRADVTDMENCLDRYGGKVLPVAFEVKVPNGSLKGDSESVISAWRVVERMNNIVNASNLPHLDIYLESTTVSPEAANRINSEYGMNASNKNTKINVGFKMRCGGMEAKAFPEPIQIADMLIACRGCKLKFTAGLHHPFRRFDKLIGTDIHGFVNVLAAGMLNHSLARSRANLVRVLVQTDPSRFALEDDGFSFVNHRLTTAEIESARKAFPGFGSCSFDEPREDLKALGWL